MIQDVILFVIGESNVYTLGNIGAHRIVCTKLPTVGHTREAMTAAGNTTTRLLGNTVFSRYRSISILDLVSVSQLPPCYVLRPLRLCYIKYTHLSCTNGGKSLPCLRNGPVSVPTERLIAGYLCT